MSFHLLDLCQRSEADYALLCRRTEACAHLGRSYELSCALPTHCTPSEATLGFCRTGTRYFLYVRPRVKCAADSSMLSGFLSRGMESFSSFSDLTAWLRRLGNELREGDRSAMPFYSDLRRAFSQQVLGQPEAVDAAAFRIAAHLCKTSPLRPLSLVLYGPTGVGKSALGKSIAPILQSIQPQHKWDCVWTELNTFTQAHTASRLIGAPPGYVGYGQRPILDAVRRNPHTVFMFDELDKAHPEILKVFMSILDEGRCTTQSEDEDGQRELDFRRCIFVFTTNANLSRTAHHPVGFSLPCSCATLPADNADLVDRLFVQDDAARRAMVRSGTLCEIAARFSCLIGFESLSLDARYAITAKQIAALGREFGLQITSVSPDIAAALTPQDAFSVRSITAILEGKLTAFFAAHCARNLSVPVQLCGSPDDMTLRTVS